MNRRLPMQLLVSLCLLLLASCQTLPDSCPPPDPSAPPPPPIIYPDVDLQSEINNNRFVQKVDNLVILLDDTESMRGCYDLVPKRKTSIAIMNSISRAVGQLPVNAGIRIFGPEVNNDNNEDVRLLYGLNHLPKTDLKQVQLTRTAHRTMLNPVSMALDAVYAEYKLIEGAAAVVIVSDFQRDPFETMRSVQMMKQYYGPRVCIYPVLVGESVNGWENAEKIAALAECGFASRAEDLKNQDVFHDTLRKILFTELPPVASVEPMPETSPPPAPESYEKTGLSYEKLQREKAISVELRTQFDFDKSVIKPEYVDHLHEVARFMLEHPDTNTVIEGHTCSIGTEKYNLELSKRRAESVKNYLVEKFGIDPGRLEIAAYGESKPIADNSTLEGRIKNRRAVATVMAIIKEPVDQQ